MAAAVGVSAAAGAVVAAGAGTVAVGSVPPQAVTSIIMITSMASPLCLISFMESLSSYVFTNRQI
jgi:hypothetical protein